MQSKLVLGIVFSALTSQCWQCDFSMMICTPIEDKNEDKNGIILFDIPGDMVK